jgi:putative oxidoreductase
MSTPTMNRDIAASPGEPAPIIPALASFYDWSRDFSWLVIRLTAGGILLVHGIVKVMGSGAPGVAGLLARLGIEPALLFGWIVVLNETVGAVCVMLGLFTRFFAASIAIELAIVTFAVNFPRGFTVSVPGGGYEYPLMWGLLMFAIALRGGGPLSLDRAIGKEL